MHAHAHAHPQARRFESKKSFSRHAKQHCPHAPRRRRRWCWGIVGPPTPRRCPAPSSNVRPRAVTERRDEVLCIPGVGGGKVREKIGRGGHTRNRIQRAAPAFPTHSLSFSTRKTTSPIAPGRREETALPVPFSTSILADPLRPPRFVPARRKDHWTRGRGASLWCSRQMRQGYRVPFWRYDSTAASKPGSFFFSSGRNEAIEKPQYLVALVLV